MMERQTLNRPDPHEDERPFELLRRYFALAGGQALGLTLLGLGAIALLIGWFGVSREVIVARQIPYLVSGGLGGAFLLGVGTFLLITHELRIDNRRLEAVETSLEAVEAALKELRDALLLPEDLPTNPVDLVKPERVRAMAGAPAATNGFSRQAAAEQFVVVNGGSRYHDPDCSVALGKPVSVVTLEGIESRHLSPCKLCAPSD